MDLDDWRSRINNLDAEILNLLNQRGSAALQIGELKRQQALPYYVPEREAEVGGAVSAAALSRWRRGVTLPDGLAVPREVRILRRGARSTWLSLTFAEGRYREVKRYCQALGHPVLRLRRVRFGPLRLGDLPVGGCRPLSPAELARLNDLRGP